MPPNKPKNEPPKGAKNAPGKDAKGNGAKDAKKAPPKQEEAPPALDPKPKPVEPATKVPLKKKALRAAKLAAVGGAMATGTGLLCGSVCLIVAGVVGLARQPAAWETRARQSTWDDIATIADYGWFAAQAKRSGVDVRYDFAGIAKSLSQVREEILAGETGVRSNIDKMAKETVVHVKVAGKAFEQIRRDFTRIQWEDQADREMSPAVRAMMAREKERVFQEMEAQGRLQAARESGPKLQNIYKTDWRSP
jgi:hypothetical protein